MLNPDLLIYCILAVPVLLFIVLPLYIFARKRLPKLRPDILNMDIVQCREAKNGDVRIGPRWFVILLGLVAGTVMGAIGVIVAISDIGTPLDFTSICLMPLASLAFIAFGLAVLVYGGRGPTLPSVTVSAANQTVAIRRPGQFTQQRFPISQITGMRSMPTGWIWIAIADASVALMGIVGAFGGHHTTTSNRGIADTANVVRLDLQLSDGQSVLLTIIPQNQLNDFRSFMHSVL